MTLENRRLLRDAFGTFMTGVTVVTTLDGAGAPIGFTANSFSSVSLDPPLLLVSIAKTSSNYARFVETEHFAINVLAEGQKDVSNTFAKPSEDRFSSVQWQSGPHGSPIISGVSAWFDCSLHQVVDAGDHAILIGRVEAFDASGQSGLGYYRGSYFTPAQAGAALASGPAVVVSALIEQDGCVLLQDDGRGGLTLPTARVGAKGATAALQALIETAGVQAVPGFIYSVYEDVAAGQQHIAFLCPSTGGTPAKGGFVELVPNGFDDVTDPAMRIMLERLAEEARVGDYGIYFGNQNTGRVAPVAPKIEGKLR
ncbi:flavin reductase family protein [Cypionkella sp.]|uniref:flavin reductase family protein n=1 Tax=Cypionkella sp. TaxID=2811411 RepID=UPI002604B4E9|nr:flavin reductase family protein [Cypionkella sp.]MDB5665579.1 flavin reductase [Cypionkella sp.]